MFLFVALVIAQEPIYIRIIPHLQLSPSKNTPPESQKRLIYTVMRRLQRFAMSLTLSRQSTISSIVGRCVGSGDQHFIKRSHKMGLTDNGFWSALCPSAWAILSTR